MDNDGTETTMDATDGPGENLKTVDAGWVDEHADHPLVRDLRARAMVAGSAAPVLEELPPWFPDWAKAVLLAGEIHLARLAGLVLYQAGTSERTLAALLVFPAARAADLPVIAEGLGAPELRPTLDELSRVANALPEAVADALVAAALPHHVNQGRAIQTLASHVDLLEVLETAPGGLVEHIVKTTCQITRDRAREQAQARPCFERFAAATRQAATRLKDGGALTVQDITRAQKAVAVPDLTTGFLELTAEEGADNPLARLILALALHRSVTGGEHEEHWRAGFAKMAADAVYDLQVPAIFELRLRLLDELVAMANPLISRAELHFQRGNTRRAISQDDPGETALALADLRSAMDMARAEGDLRLYASATAAWARTIAWVVTGGGEIHGASLDDALGEISRGRTLPLGPGAQVRLHQARAHLLRARSPQDAIPALEEALALVTQDEPIWAELAAEIVGTLVRAGQTEGAVERGLGCLECTSCSTDRTELGMLHLATGEALAAVGRFPEARRQLETGLALVRGRDAHNEVLAHLHLAQVGLATSEKEMLKENLRFLQDHRDELDHLALRDLHLMEAASARQSGDLQVQRSSLLEALKVVPDDTEGTRIRLELACLDLRAGCEVDPLDSLVERAMGLAEHRGIAAVMTDLVCNHDAPLSTATRQAVVRWAETFGRPSVVAKMHHEAGRAENCRSVLRDALSGELEDGERMACVHLLVTTLDHQDSTERRQLCELLEPMLEDVQDEPHVRLDLAAALRLEAGGDPDVLWRARRHAMRGAEELRDQRSLEHAHRTLGLITLDLIRSSLPESSEAQADLASWLLEERAIPAQELAQIRLAAVHALLLPGPMVHEEVLAVARRLVSLVGESPSEEEGLAALGERLDWIDRCVETGTMASSAPGTITGPLDDLPPWLVALVLDREPQVSSDELSEGVVALRSALEVRPEVADRVLGALLPLQYGLTGRTQRDFLDVVYSTVQSIAAHGEDAWRDLRRALASIPQEDRHPTLADIASAAGRTLPLERRTTGKKHRARGKKKARQGKRWAKRTAWSGGRQRARAAFEQGVALMMSLQQDPVVPDAAERIRESRELLGESVRIARKKKMPEIFDFLVSYGNAWKTRPGEDLEKSLRIYASTEKVQATPDQRAKLWKVKADALRARGRPDDIRLADELLTRSLKVRRGWLRAEALLSAAQVARVHPDLEEPEQEMRAAKHLMDAVRADRQHAAQMMGFLLECLAAWQRHRPDDPRPARLREELKSIYPEKTEEIDTSRARPSEREVESIVQMLHHPAGKAFMDVRVRLVAATERMVDPFGLAERFGPTVKAKMEEDAERRSLIGQPEEAEVVLASLSETSTDDVAHPGVLAARVVLLAHLVRLGRGQVEAVQDATREALAALTAVDALAVRTTLLREIAVVWCPDDHADDLVRDFGLAVGLLQECVELEGGEELALGDTLAFLARSLRYSPAGDRRENLREARKIYQACLARARVSGGADVIANLVHNLAEVEGQMGEGGRLDRLRRNEASLREAVATARSPHKKAQFMANLAWEEAQIGSILGGAEGKIYMEQALATFGQVDPTLLSDSARRNLESNCTVCEAKLARLAGGRDAEIDMWRRRLAELDPDSAPYSVATAKHNLASTLVFGQGITPERLAEGLRLLKEAIEVRTPEANARHCWETAINAGHAILAALQSGREDLLPMSHREAVAEARYWLRLSIKAAQTLGPGEELADAAFAMCDLAHSAPSTAEFMERTEEAWSIVREAAAFLILERKSREREAWTALQVSAALALRLAESALSVAAPGIVFVLQGDRAEFVGRWLARSQEPARRPLRARLSRPGAVSASLWQDWLIALGERDQRCVADMLDRIHAGAPEFPAESAADMQTWRWLEAQPGSIALTLVLAEPAAMALVMQADDSGNHGRWVLGLDMPPPPLPLDSLTGLMRGALPGPDAAAALEELAAWVRDHAVAPVVRFLGEQPSVVLWSPGPGLRLIAPGAIWRGVPVATTASLALPDLMGVPGRRRSTLLVLADPGDRAPQPRLDLRGQGVPALKSLSGTAAARGPVRVVASQGACSGRALLGDQAGLRDTPASAGDVLAEACEHDVVVLIAHGEVENLEDAAILCLGAEGGIDRLNVERLSRQPDQFAGATVLLLSCESGRIGDSLADPGGIAGTLLSAGARCVVAPLWPVRLDVAVQVGEAVLRGLAKGEQPWAALAALEVQSAGDSPPLGSPPPSLSDRRAAVELQRLAFVTWVG